MPYEILPYERIRELRIDAGLTQDSIAELLHVKENTYSQYELGLKRVPVAAFITLATFYGTSTDYLLGLTDHRGPV